jgi:protein-disulfide isomerase
MRTSNVRVLEIISRIAVIVACLVVIMLGALQFRLLRLQSAGLATMRVPVTATAQSPWRAPVPTSSPLPVDRVDGVELSLTPGRRSGQPLPRVVLVEFSDYQCPYSRRYAQETYPKIRTRFVETGAIEYVFRHFPLESIHPLAFRASEAAECAGNDGRQSEMRKLMFEDQEALDETHLLALAKVLNVEATRFTSCLVNHDTASKIRRDIDEGVSIGVNSTPMFLLGLRQANNKIKITKRIKGALPYEMFEMTVREVIDSSTATTRGQ